MIIKVFSNYKLSEADKIKIRYIIRASNCPNESFRHTFGKLFGGYQENVLRLDGKKASDVGYVEEIEVNMEK